MPQDTYFSGAVFLGWLCVFLLCVYTNTDAEYAKFHPVPLFPQSPSLDQRTTLQLKGTNYFHGRETGSAGVHLANCCSTVKSFLHSTTHYKQSPNRQCDFRLPASSLMPGPIWFYYFVYIVIFSISIYVNQSRSGIEGI